MSETIRTNESLFRELADCTDPAHREWIRNELVERNEGLVMVVVERFMKTGIPFQDLYAEALYGLGDAIRCYRVETKNKFSTYAYTVMVRKIKRLIVVESRRRERLPTVSVEYGEDYQSARSNRFFVPRQRPLRPWCEWVHERLGLTRALSDRERAILAMRFPPTGAVLTLEQCGNLLGIGKERVRQVQKMALLKLKEELDGQEV